MAAPIFIFIFIFSFIDEWGERWLCDYFVKFSDFFWGPLGPQIKIENLTIFNENL